MFRNQEANTGSGTERQPPVLQTGHGRPAGDDRIQRIMILALAIRHRMERPAISMEGGATPMEQFATAVCLTYEKNNIYSGGSSMDKQIEESEPKKQEEILSFGGVAISVKYAEQDDPHITEALKRSVFSYGFYNNICKT